MLAPILTCLGRILRYLAAVNDIVETRQDTWAPNNTTRALASPAATAGIAHGLVVLPAPSLDDYHLYVASQPLQVYN